MKSIFRIWIVSIGLCLCSEIKTADNDSVVEKLDYLAYGNYMSIGFEAGRCQTIRNLMLMDRVEKTNGSRTVVINLINKIAKSEGLTATEFSLKCKESVSKYNLNLKKINSKLKLEE